MLLTPCDALLDEQKGDLIYMRAAFLLCVGFVRTVVVISGVSVTGIE
jgi:hypothetical protein